jgi:hypothetical protein
MPTSDFRAFAEVFQGSQWMIQKSKGSHPYVPGLVAAIIERGLSGDSRNAISFVEIFEILRQNRFEIVASVDCDEISKFVNWVKSSAQSVQ